MKENADKRILDIHLEFNHELDEDKRLALSALIDKQVREWSEREGIWYLDYTDDEHAAEWKYSFCQECGSFKFENLDDCEGCIQHYRGLEEMRREYRND